MGSSRSLPFRSDRRLVAHSGAAEWTKEELHQVIEWLTGYSEGVLKRLVAEKVTFEQFFRDARLNPNAHLITGVICGYRVEEIENPLTRQVRYLDKLVDGLAKGRPLGKILRAGEIRAARGKR